MSDTLKPYHWGKAEARFFVAQDDVENRGWGVFEMGADVPILFWCASKTDAETAALRLNHINEQFLTCRRSQLDPKPLDTGGVEGGGALSKRVAAIFDAALELDNAASAVLDSNEHMKTQFPDSIPSRLIQQGDLLRLAIASRNFHAAHLAEKPADSMGGEDDVRLPIKLRDEQRFTATLTDGYAVADAPGDVTESVASDGWRSIDSPPKDAEFLAYNDSDEYGIAEWREDDLGWAFATPEWIDSNAVLVAWKPLGPPPTIGEKESATEANSVTPQGAQD